MQQLLLVASGLYVDGGKRWIVPTPENHSEDAYSSFL